MAPMDSRPSSPRRSRAQPAVRSRRRAIEACTFCRRRKIKCNGERPVCLNCKAYDHDCSYERVSEVLKEAGRERHNRSKRRKTESHDGGNGDGDGPAAVEEDLDSQRRIGNPTVARHGKETDDDNVATPALVERTAVSREPGQAFRPSRAPEASVARILVSANGVSSYHGRTSALFEDNVQERPIAGESCPRMPDDWVERGLVAEAARQRQMEELNYRDGKLDFDGVDPELGMHLLSLHWNRQHHSFLITYRPAFMRDMACSGPYFSKLLLNAIYFGASKFSPRLEVRRDHDDVRTAGWQYRERVRELLGSSLDRGDVTTIQALLQMTNSLFALGDERSAAWLYSGLAFRMLIDLGIHVDLTSTGRFSDEDLEIRRRVFWGAFVVDKIQSLYQGRPVTLKDTDALVPIRFLDTYEELEHWQPFAYSTAAGPDYPGSPAYSTSTFTLLCKLSIAMSDILSCIYTERSFDQSPADLACMLDKLQVKLDKWRESIPGHLQFDPANKLQISRLPPPHVFSLHAMYNVLVILLHRPFVADGHLYSTSRNISVDSFMKCASAASNISSLLRAYHRAFSIRRAPYLISYSTYVAATIHTRIAARRGSDSAAHANLVTCLAVFEVNQETNSAVKKAAIIVRGLMRKHGVVVESVSSKDLEIVEPLGKSKDQEQDSGRAVSETEPQNPALNLEVNDSSTSNPSNSSQSTMAALSAGQTGYYSPGSDWLDVDGIIQNFLLENDNAHGTAPSDPEAIPPSQVPREQWAVQQGGNGTQPLMMEHDFAVVDQQIGQGLAPDSNGVIQAEGTYASAGYQWHQGWRPSNSDHASLEDPLFGFNGSSLDGFPFMGW